MQAVQGKTFRGRILWACGVAAVFACAGAGDSPAAVVSVFQAGEGAWQLGAMGVGNLDGDASLEIVVPYRDPSGSWHLDAFKPAGQRVAGFPYSAGTQVINVSPALCDLDGDGRDEILITRGNRVVALRGNGTELWSREIEAASYVPDGGYQTVLGGFYWSGSGAFQSRLPADAVFSSEVSPPLVADLSGSGALQVVTAWKIDPDPDGGAQDFNPFVNDVFGGGEWGTLGETWSGGIVTLDARSGQPASIYHLHHLLEAGLAVGRPGATLGRHIYGLNDSDSVVAFDPSRPFGLWGSGMLHGQFGKNQRLMSGSYQVPIDIHTADLDHDGADEVLVAGTQLSTMWQPNETILDRDGAILWRRWLPQVTIGHQHGWHNSASLIPLNPDGDNHADVLGFNHSYELTFRHWNGVNLVDNAGWPRNFHPRLPTPPVVADVDGDGAQEILVGTYHPVQKPSTGALEIYSLAGVLEHSVSVPGGLKHIPVVADVNADGSLDVVIRSMPGQVSVLNFGATGTVSAAWSAHRGNMRRDGNRGQTLFPPGTPRLGERQAGRRHTTFSWSTERSPRLFKIFRAEAAVGPFVQIAALTPSTLRYTDRDVRPGWQYLYEIAAVYPDAELRSAPFPLLPLASGNLVLNAGFEENDNSRWDKWFTGAVAMTNMVVTTNQAVGGRQSMRIILRDDTGGGSIAQFNQYGIPAASLPVQPGGFYSFGGYFRSTAMTQRTEHWLEWSSTATASRTNQRAARPWPLYFTPHFVAGSAPRDWRFVNRVVQLPQGFPNIELRHAFSADAPASGSVYIDNVFFRRLPEPESPEWTTLVRMGGRWRYSAQAPAAGWTAEAFDDSDWPLANAKFGAGGGPAAVVTRLPPLRPAYYFRTRFEVPPGEIEDLLLEATCTDDCSGVVYPLRVFLNGTEVDAAIETVTSQGNERRYFDLTPFAALLRPGGNSLAVKLGNAWTDWDDVAFDLGLKAVLSGSAAGRALLRRESGGGLRLCADTPSGSIWELQSSASLLAPAWERVEVFTNHAGGTFCAGGIEAAVRAPGPGRFFRIVPFSGGS